MDSPITQLPLTVRRSIEVVGLCTVGLIIILGQGIIMPLLMAFFMSVLLLPLFRWLQRIKVPETPAIIICLVALILAVAGVMTFLSYQIAGLLSDIGTIQKNLMVHWANISAWINQKLHFTAEQQLVAINKQVANIGPTAGRYAQGAAVSLTSVLVFVGLLPIYIFLILFYRNLLLRFTYMWFEEPQHQKVGEAIREMETIVKYYLVGLLIQIAYLTVLVGGVLLLFGIKHAILIGITFAILNLIPYVGALVGNLIGVILTLTSSQDMTQIWIVLGTIAAVQFLDNNILMPRIVGSKVKVNALASIVGIVIGGTMAGVTGMFLSIPIMAVLKIMFDKSTPLRKWGVLLGDARPELSPMGARMFRFGKQRPTQGAGGSAVKDSLEAQRDSEVRKKVEKAGGGPPEGQAE